MSSGTAEGLPIRKEENAVIAHIHPVTRRTQTLSEHARNTARLAARALLGSQLFSMGMLAGLLHDMGKATRSFEEYLLRAAEQKEKKRGKAAPHAPVGAIFAYERWFEQDGDRIVNLTAQLISMAVQGHHAGLYDSIDLSVPCASPYLASILQDKSAIHYEEAVRCFLEEVVSEAELDEWFHKACREVEVFLSRSGPDMANVSPALLARLLLGALADGDCWDTACFEGGGDPFQEDAATSWEVQKGRLDRFVSCFSCDTEISRIRRDVGNACAKVGRSLPEGIYRLTVPTGGGKTLASLRLALEQACAMRKDTSRIFYIAPYNTILEQNASVIRQALENDPGILEHHGDIVRDDESEGEPFRRRLTERWTSTVILTSMVQFLDTFFGPRNSQARRLPRLAQSILIFDEIQALPRKCTALFSCAIRFLAVNLHCTVILCTATQPTLLAYNPDMRVDIALLKQLPELGTELLPDVLPLFEKLRRVRFDDQTTCPRDNAKAAADIVSLVRRGQSVLTVVNTRSVAGDLFSRIFASDLPQGTVCIHLSTGMCAAHRRQKLDLLKSALDRRKSDPDAPPVCCISTQLIEAGVDISFPVVIRSLAGLPSILQAAGRCNRSMESDCGTVHLWRMSEENLSSLPEIRDGQNDTMGILAGAGQQAQSLDDPELIRVYYAKTLFNRPQELFYPVEDDLLMTRLLSRNQKLCKSMERLPDPPTKKIELRANWRMASEAFHVIDQDTVMVLTPYEEGRGLIAELCQNHSMDEEKRLLRMAQQYGVNLYRSDYQRLMEAGALYSVGQTGAVALREEFHDDRTGVLRQGNNMPFLAFEGGERH